MGVVVAATHLQLDQRVAIKFMLPEAFANPEAIARFNREARAAVKLRSEHVARVLDTGTFETGAPYIVMEFLEGVDLSAELARSGPLHPSAAAEYLVQACEAIAEAHSLGIVHRDLKPANLFLTRRPDGSPLVKVLDFGISKATSLGDSGLQMTKTAAVMGSPLYMSPEQMKSAKDVDGRTDVWSLGVILYELLGGAVPFNSDTLGALMASVLTEPPAPLVTRRAGLPPELYAIVDRCLQKDRQHRCQNVAELAMALAPFCPPRTHPIVERITGMLGNSVPRIAMGNRPPSAPLPTGAKTGSEGWDATDRTRTRPTQGRTALVWVGVSGVILIVLGVGGFFGLRGRMHASAAGGAQSAAAPAAAAALSASAPAMPSEAATLAPLASADPAPTSSAPAPVSSGKTWPGRGQPPHPSPAGKGGAPATPAATAPVPAAPPTPPPPATTAQKPGILDTSN